MDRIYVQTNDAEHNEVVVFDRAPDGSIEPIGRFDTGGRGSGEPPLASQSSLALNDGSSLLLVTNAGSDQLSLFAVQDVGLQLERIADTGGRIPTSVAVHGETAYVLNAGGEGGIAGFSLAGRALEPIEGSTRPLSVAGADPAAPRGGNTCPATSRCSRQARRRIRRSRSGRSRSTGRWTSRSAGRGRT